MAKKHMYFDRDEIILECAESKQSKPLTLEPDRIEKIVVTVGKQKKLFRKITTNQIEIYRPSYEYPLIYTEADEKQYFEQYVAGLKNFASNHRIKFVDNH